MIYGEFSECYLEVIGSNPILTTNLVANRLNRNWRTVRKDGYKKIDLVV